MVFDALLGILLIPVALMTAVYFTYLWNHGSDWDVEVREDFYGWLDKPKPQPNTPEDSGPDYDYDDETADAVEEARERYTDPDNDYGILDYENDIEDILDGEEPEDDEEEEQEEEEVADDEADDAGSDEENYTQWFRDDLSLDSRAVPDSPTHTHNQIQQALRQNLKEALFSGEPIPATPHGAMQLEGVIKTTLEKYHPDPHVDVPVHEGHLHHHQFEFTAPDIAHGTIEINSAGLNIRVNKHTEPEPVEVEPTVERDTMVENGGISVSRYSHHVKIALPETDDHRHTLSHAYERGSTLNIAVEDENGNTVTYHDAAITDYSEIAAGAGTVGGRTIGSVVYDIEATSKIPGTAPDADIDLTTASGMGYSRKQLELR